MNWIIDFFTSIFSLFSSLVDLILSVLISFLNFLYNLPVFINFITGSLVSLPGFLVPFAIYSVTLAVAFLIVGRGKSI